MKKEKRLVLNPIAKSFIGEHGAKRRTQVHRSKKKYYRKTEKRKVNNLSFFLCVI